MQAAQTIQPTRETRFLCKVDGSDLFVYVSTDANDFYKIYIGDGANMEYIPVQFVNPYQDGTVFLCTAEVNFFGPAPGVLIAPQWGGDWLTVLDRDDYDVIETPDNTVTITAIEVIDHAHDQGVSMTTTEFPVDLDEDNEGLGTLIVTDARLLIRPAVAGQLHGSVMHDSAHAYQVLYLGNDMGHYTMHIICHADPDAAQQMLSPVFYAFLDACCLQLWCDANVNYIVDGTSPLYEEHGFEDGAYTMHINVHCGVAEDAVEDLLAKLTGNLAEDDRFIVVRPDDSSEYGYAARGFTVDDTSDEEIVDAVPVSSVRPDVFTNCPFCVSTPCRCNPPISASAS